MMCAESRHDVGADSISARVCRAAGPGRYGIDPYRHTFLRVAAAGTPSLCFLPLYKYFLPCQRHLRHPPARFGFDQPHRVPNGAGRRRAGAGIGGGFDAEDSVAPGCCCPSCAPNRSPGRTAVLSTESSASPPPPMQRVPQPRLPSGRVCGSVHSSVSSSGLPPRSPPPNRSSPCGPAR